MKTLIRCTFGFAILPAAIGLNLHADNLPPGYVDFGKLSPASGAEFVQVHITSNMISMAAGLAEKSQPEIAELLRGIKRVQVNVIGLTEENRADMEQRVKTIRNQLEAQGWEAAVTVQDRKEDVGIYIKTHGDKAVQGLVVTVLDGKKEAVLVNIVGDIRPEKLSAIGERFNIDPLKKIGGAGK